MFIQNPFQRDTQSRKAECCETRVTAESALILKRHYLARFVFTRRAQDVKRFFLVLQASLKSSIEARGGVMRRIFEYRYQNKSV